MSRSFLSIGAGIWAGALLLGASYAQAFPEMVRHGYANCTACHVSPTGGGTLTEYGRALSKEVLSTWSFDGEERVLYFFKTPKWLSVGGDFRAISIEQHTSNSTSKQYIPMQRDVEAAVNIGRRLVVDVAYGYRDPTPLENNEWFSRRHFLLYKFNKEVSMRVGRFFPSFGIYIPEHNTMIRRGLVWDEGMESYNLEFSYLGEKYNLQLSAIFGRPDNSKLYREQGLAVNWAYNYGESYKFGVSYYYGASELVSHHIIGPYGILGFRSNFFLLSQIDAVRTYASTFTDPQWGMVDYQRLDYEPFQGVHFYLTQELSQTDFNQGAGRTDIYGIGTQLFPRPHFEFQGFIQRQLTGGQQSADIYALYFHYYL